jgi:hypothetical protein
MFIVVACLEMLMAALTMNQIIENKLAYCVNDWSLAIRLLAPYGPVYSGRLVYLLLVMYGGIKVPSTC